MFCQVEGGDQWFSNWVRRLFGVRETILHDRETQIHTVDKNIYNWKIFKFPGCLIFKSNTMAAQHYIVNQHNLDC